MQGNMPGPDADLPYQRELVEALLATSRAGNFGALLAVLDPDVVFRVDPGEASPPARQPITGAANVAEQILAPGSYFAPGWPDPHQLD